MRRPSIEFLPPGGSLAHRLWRLRRRRDHLDASVRPAGQGWELSFSLNDRPLVAWIIATREAAVHDAETRRADLLRAGWNVHW